MAETAHPTATAPANAQTRYEVRRADLPLSFTDVTPTSIIPNDSFTVANYVYGAPESLGSSTVYLMPLENDGGYSYSFTVPGQYTSGGSVAASFDQFGSYADRGRRFAAAVHEHLGGNADGDDGSSERS